MKTRCGWRICWRAFSVWIWRKEQELLEAETRVDALRLIHSYLSHELQVLELRQKIASTARDEMRRSSASTCLRQQLRAIQQELGEKDR